MSAESTPATNHQSQPATSLTKDEINVFDLLVVLAKRLKMIIGVPFLVSIFTAIITSTMPNIYTAKTMIIPIEENSGGMGAALLAQLGALSGFGGGSLGGKTTAELYVTMLKSEALKDPIIDKFNLMKKYEAKLRSRVYRGLDGAVDLSLSKKDGVITIKFSDKDPKFAAEIANAYVVELGKLATSLAMNQAGANSVFFEKRITSVKADLDKAADAVKKFQQQHKIISPTEQAQATIASIAQLKGQLAVLEVQLASLQRKYTDNSQEVKNTRASIANIRGQIGQLEGQGSGGAIPGVEAVPALGEQYLRLMRDFKIQETVFEMLTKQYELAQINQAKDIAPFHVLQKATVPELKSKPKRARIVIMSAFATGFLMVLLAFIQDMLERMPLDDRKRWGALREVLPDLPKPVKRLLKLFKAAKT